MAESIPLSSQLQISRSVTQVVSFGDNGSIDTFLVALPVPSKIGHCDFPSLQEDMQGPHDVDGQDVHHLIPGPAGVVATSEYGDGVNQQILQEEQLDVEAVRTILPLAFLDNVITVQHYWWVLKHLRDHLIFGASPHRIPHGEAYRRVLLRLATRLTPLTSNSQQDSVQPGPATLDYLCPDFRPDLRPLGDVDCLDKLLTDIEGAFVVLQQTGSEEDVHIVEDRELPGYTEWLRSLASRLPVLSVTGP